MVHPISQVVFKESGRDFKSDLSKFRELRNKLNLTKPF